jgi:hypothetical protein
MNRTSKPLLITGSPRSGTTWAGKILSLSPSLRYIAEPFNPLISKEYYNLSIPYWFLNINTENEHLYLNQLKNILRISPHLSDLSNNIKTAKTLRSKAGELKYYLRYMSGLERPLIKDPIALMSAEWLAGRFNMDVLVLIRHPAAFVNSAKRVNWSFNLAHILAQPALMHRLKPFQEEMTSSVGSDKFSLNNSILFWNIVHHLIRQYQDQNPTWIFIRHEDISKEPIIEFKKIFNRLDINFDSGIEKKIIAFSGNKNRSEISGTEVHIMKRNSLANIKSWKNKLSSIELEKIYSETYTYSKHFYSEEDWK